MKTPFVRQAFTAFLLAFCVLGLRPHADAAAPPPANHAPYLVLAHYMPCFPPLGISGNTYWYACQYSPVYDNLTARPILYPGSPNTSDVDARVAEIRLAKSYGIDGFMVDELEDNQSYRQAWTTLMKAAEIVGDFKVGLQPDYATLANSAATAEEPARLQRDKIKHWIDLVKDSPALLRFDGKPVVIPYGAGYPDARLNGAGATISYAEGQKTSLVDWMAAQGEPIAYGAMHSLSWPIYSNPYANDPKTGFQTFAFATSTFSPGDNVNTMAGAVNTRQRALDYWPSNFMQIGEATFLYQNKGAHWYTAPRLSTTWRQDWEWNVAHRDRIRWVEIITWNDFGESAVSPSVNHFMSLQPVTRYYTEWFKTGVKPKIAKDVITIFHRDAPLAAVPTKYPVRLGGDVATDEVEALALLTAPATLVLQSGTTEYRQQVPAGLQSLIKPFALGIQSARIERRGKVIASVTSPLPIHDKPARDNMWIDGATSAYPARPITLNNWTAASGEWVGTEASRTGQGLALVGNGSQLGNVSTSALVAATFAANGDCAGVVAHATGTTYYRLALGQWDGKRQWRLSRFDQGKETMLDSGETATGGKAPRGLRLDCVGEHLIVYLDGHLVSSNVYDYPDWQGPMRTYGQSGVAADGVHARCTKISVKSYDPDPYQPLF